MFLCLRISLAFLIILSSCRLPSLSVLSPFGQAVKNEIETINEENLKRPYRHIKKYALNDLAKKLYYDNSYLSKILHLNNEGMPIRRLSLFDAVRIIVVLRPSISRANEMIKLAGYCIDYDYDCNAAIYRNIINHLTSNAAEDHNKRLEMIKLTDSRKVDAKSIFEPFDRPMSHCK
ncbi:MAG: hypothetical protein IJJ99_03295 [Oscillospiraceae bacterium]|nr:hypothetical protein [Oscillospiraceae bacterium]